MLVMNGSTHMTNMQPKTGWRWLVEQTATFDMATAGFTALLGSTSAIDYAVQGHHRLATTIAAGTAGVLLLTIARNAVTLRQVREKTSMHELEGCLFTLHAALDSTAMQTVGKLRLAIHVAAAGETLMQVTEYVGDTLKKGRVGRKFPRNAGIIGEAFREGGGEYDAFVGERVNDDYEAYVEELVQDWNYTRERAVKINPAVKSWMAVPFTDPDGHDVKAVLYLDSTEKHFFTPERQELVVQACNGIAVFIGKRYSS
jgi:hypothetical protein